ncbi:chemotaxis protein CheD [Planctomyces sp. SH-PL62]|uniref:chemotaxis protein CheD n=1 Tax=Planctomyces sp. SH-PL62 TaxID=1636152 RepID=UPI00078EF0B8|nr:chemotaxis protein CheD [Planctomyces sp. SH-PL62]AMV39065.1 Chemoreceptor glutamine deamidase CheD [Planctomyces sp. SH-PL62]
MAQESDANSMVSVAIGRWGVAAAPSRLRTLLGSCVGVVLHDRSAKLGGLAHIVLPDSRGVVDQPGKYADTAIPALIAELEKLMRGKAAGRLVAKLAGGASMFQVGPPGAAAAPTRNIGRMNQEAVEAILATLRIPILARDLGGDGGRNLIFDPATGRVQVRTPGGVEREI